MQNIDNNIALRIIIPLSFQMARNGANTMTMYSILLLTIEIPLIQDVVCCLDGTDMEGHIR